MVADSVTWAVKVIINKSKLKDHCINQQFLTHSHSQVKCIVWHGTCSLKQKLYYDTLIT